MKQKYRKPMSIKKLPVRIYVTDGITAQLKSEFSTTNTTLLMALRFVNNSALAKRIRKSAIEKMRLLTADNEEAFQTYDAD